MKLAVRILGLFVVLAGAAAASLSSSTANVTASSHQSATARLPIPTCTPNIPTCPTQPSPNQQ